MTGTQTTVRVVLSCPGDVDADKLAVERAAAELNETWGDHLHFHLLTSDWRSHAVPGLGAYPQDVINKTAFSEYDILVGLMGARFGTPTLQAGSGTEEELNGAIARARSDGGRTKILFYFRRRGDIFSIDLLQAQKVERFRERLTNEGLLWDQYGDESELEAKVRRHLARCVQDLLPAGNNS